jgi:hypothetical protein
MKMIHFVCKTDSNQIIKITKQRKRAEDMMTKLNIIVLSYNPKIFPLVNNLKVGDIINEFQIESVKNYI